MERKRRAWLVLMLTVTLFACSGNGNTKKVADHDFYGNHDAIENPPAGEMETTEALIPVNRPHYHTVEIKQMKFVPAELNAQRGDTIVWINNDITVHDVTEQQSHAWSSKEMPVGATWTMIADKSADYYCSIHVVMKGKLLVKE